jgi:hypothetical protein
MDPRANLPEPILFKRRVEVFKTNVEHPTQAHKLAAFLTQQFGLFSVNFDLDDCDHVLRVEDSNINPERIMSALHAIGYQCEPLE